ncbi:MAG TPA: hypothetical protein VGB17_00300 [Pyrinomonadaceae bacterium]|jgi:hypothetical protein
MSRKRFIIIAVALVLLLGLELGREQLVYLYFRSGLGHGYWQIRPGMTKGEVAEKLGQPDRMQQEGAEESWRWLALEHQGWLWRATRLASLKKHYELTVSFDRQGLAADKFGEVR